MDRIMEQNKFKKKERERERNQYKCIQEMHYILQN